MFNIEKKKKKKKKSKNDKGFCGSILCTRPVSCSVKYS